MTRIPDTLRLHLLERALFNSSLQLTVAGKILVIGHELAGVLRVSTEAEFDVV